MLAPELFRKLPETPGNHFHIVSSKSQPGCPSYDQRTKLNIWRSLVLAVLVLTVLVLTVVVLTVLAPLGP